jgi:putative flippase GtrA
VVLLNAQVHGLGWNMYVANFIAIVLVSFWNFRFDPQI